MMRATTELFRAIFPGWTVVNVHSDERQRSLHVHLSIGEREMQAAHGPQELVDLLAARPVRARRPTGIRFHGRIVGKR